MDLKRWIVPRLAASYGAVILAAVPMFVPRCNSGYLGHAGAGYLLIPVASLAALLGLGFIVWRAPRNVRRPVISFIGISLGAYFIVTLGAA